jgi:transcriptional regulator with XRE-family HTH domain
MQNQEKIFSERLRRAREAKDLSQTGLAERCGLQPSAISHFETGRRLPSFDNLKRLADALSVTMDYLLGRSDEMRSCGIQSQEFFRDFDKMSAQDRDMIGDFVKMLAEKNKKRLERGHG